MSRWETGPFHSGMPSQTTQCDIYQSESVCSSEILAHHRPQCLVDCPFQERENKSQIATLERQLYPGRSRVLTEAYEDL